MFSFYFFFNYYWQFRLSILEICKNNLIFFSQALTAKWKNKCKCFFLGAVFIILDVKVKDQLMKCQSIYKEASISIFLETKVRSIITINKFSFEEEDKEKKKKKFTYAVPAAAYSWFADKLMDCWKDSNLVLTKAPP